jgi:hypothetical protein
MGAKHKLNSGIGLGVLPSAPITQNHQGEVQATADGLIYHDGSLWTNISNHTDTIEYLSVPFIASGTQNLALLHAPIPGSFRWYINGLEQKNSSLVISGANITLDWSLELYGTDELKFVYRYQF